MDTAKVKNKIVKEIKSLLQIAIGILLAAIGLESFLIPNGYLDGGITGSSLLLKQFSSLPFSILLFLLNLPFLILGFKTIGKTFAMKSLIAIGTLAITVQFVHFPVLTDAVFGGVFVGAGIGFAVRGGAVLDGTEILAIFINRKTRMSIGDIILIFNLFIFAAAAFLISIEISLYAVLTYFIASKTITFILEGIEEYTSIMIMSDKADEIRYMINTMGFGVTVLDIKQGYGKQVGEALNPAMALMTIVTRLEITKVLNAVQDLDPKAFIIMNSVNDTQGGMIRKRSINH